MRNLAFAALITCACLLGESPTDVFSKAPPDVDKALRARVAHFLDAHVAGKFRAAEKVVHEDSQDIFYNGHKQRLLSWDITQITYSENFTKAVVIATVEVEWVTPRLGRMRMKPPMKTLWKVDGGEWWWYAEPQAQWETPFGVMKPREPVAGAPNGGAPAIFRMPQLNDILSKVRVSRKDIRLSSYEKSEDFAEITNDMQGDLTLAIEKGSLPEGLVVRLSSEKVATGQTARVTFSYAPPNRSPKASQEVRVTAQPINQTYVFSLTFAVPPELEKLLPKKP